MRSPMKEKAAIEHEVFGQAIAALAKFHGGQISIPVGSMHARITYTVVNGIATFRIAKPQ